MKVRDYGGKANRLHRLKQLSLPVPPFFVVKQEELNQSFVQNKLNQLNGQYFAVRSSANIEDGAKNSYAGIFKTYLFIKRDEVFEKIKEVIKSANTKQVEKYQSSIGGEGEIEMNVIVQEMIDADVSGVAFGENFDNKEEIIVSSSFGLGQAIVDGTINTDNFSGKIDNWKTNLTQKSKALFFDRDGLKIDNVSDSKQLNPSLSETQLNEIYNVLKQLENEFKAPQDIEFCYSNDQFYLLQSRDITTIDTSFVIWDNSNIVESYPGITSPFTFSFIKDIYATAYKNFALLLGVSPRQVEANNEVFNEMLGHIKGRVYYHLINWYKALSLLPGYKINAPFMEKMMGVEEPLGIDVVANQPSSKLQAYGQLLQSLFKLWKTNKQLPKLKEEFVELVHKTIEQYRLKDYGNADLDYIWNDYLEFKSLLVNRWQPPLANDLFAMIYYGALDKFCSKNFDNTNLHTKLIVGRHEVISMQPALLIEEIISKAQKEEWLTTLQTENPEEVWELSKKGELNETGRLIVKYINEFGDRSVGELKLEHDTFRQNPASFIKILSSYTYKPIAKTDLKVDSLNLESELKDQLPLFKKRWFSYLVKKASETVADRENLRLERTKAFGVVREIINAIGLQLFKEGLINNPKDVYYLTETEIGDYINGNSLSLLDTINERKQDYKDFLKYNNLPNRIKQKGILKESDLQNLKPLFEGDLEGIACSEGVVRGRVRIMHKPDEVKSLEGDILVTQSTDPGWITIFTSAGGILVERGSALSHASIVSRELGIPCIVAVKGITQRLKTGDLIEMDGKTGKIKIIE